MTEQSPAERFFGLSARPFSLTPDLRFAYHSRSHTHALEQVTSALRRREGLVVVTGVIGTGKTVLCRTLLETFESRTFLSLILDPGLRVEDLLRKVLSDFGIINAADAPASGPLTEVTRHQYVTALQQFLASLIPLQAHAVIMIDEAQHLSPRVLEEIRLLSNFETDEAKLLQIVLVGQPDLDDLLRRDDMQQLNQRVARRCQLHPLAAGEVADYIERRLTVAAAPGGDPDAVIDTNLLVRFTPAASRAVADISGGIPRVVNTLCDRTLDVAYERQTRLVEPDLVAEAAERLQLDIPRSVPRPSTGRLPRLALVAVLLALLAAGAWWWFGSASPAVEQRAPERPAPSAPAPDAPRASADTPVPDSTAAPAAPAPTETTPATPPATAAPEATTAAPPQADAARPLASPASAPEPPAGSFQIAVAAFRTERRAQDVARRIAEMPLPVTVRPDSTGAWFRVISGPFATRDAVDAAQTALTRAGFGGTRVSQVP